MLITDRKAGDKVAIGAGIVIEVLSIKGRVVRLGVSAPSGVSIRRAELPARFAAVDAPAVKGSPASVASPARAPG